jgi:iron complex transport system permease protein
MSVANPPFPLARPHALPFGALCLVLVGVLALVGLLSLARGIVPIAPAAIPGLLMGADADSLASIVVWDVRLPRFVLAALAGAALAASGVLMQGALRNDLAEPGLLGVASGASLVVATLIVFEAGLPDHLLPLAALGGGLVSGALILVATRATRDPVRMILIGAALAALFQAAITFVMVLGNAFQLQRVFAFLVGSLVGRDGADVARMAPWVLASLPLALLLIRPLDVLRLGDDTAEALGVGVFRIRLVILGVAILLVAPVVATCGPIAFLALIAPHMARAALRASDAARVLPLAMLIGAALLAAADLLAREALKPMELPVGLVLTALGAPAAIWLLRRHLAGRTG